MAATRSTCHIRHMTENRPKRPRDPNQLAKSIVDALTQDDDNAPPATADRAEKGHLPLSSDRSTKSKKRR
jgi:hypothetical protein